MSSHRRPRKSRRETWRPCLSSACSGLAPYLFRLASCSHFRTRDTHFTCCGVSCSNRNSSESFDHRAPQTSKCQTHIQTANTPPTRPNTHVLAAPSQALTQVAAGARCVCSGFGVSVAVCSPLSNASNLARARLTPPSRQPADCAASGTSRPCPRAASCRSCRATGDARDPRARRRALPGPCDPSPPEGRRASAAG